MLDIFKCFNCSKLNGTLFYVGTVIFQIQKYIISSLQRFTLIIIPIRQDNIMVLSHFVFVQIYNYLFNQISHN